MSFGSVSGFGNKVGGDTTYKRNSPTTITVGGALIGTIPNGSIEDILDKILYPNIPPAVTVSVSPSTPRGFNEINFNLNIQAIVIRTIAASTLTNAKLFVSRDGNNYQELQSITPASSSSLSQTISFSVNNFNPTLNNSPIYFRVLVSDSIGQVVTTTAESLIFATYSQPSISLNRIPSGNREKGLTSNISLSLTATRNSPFTNLLSVQFQRQVNNGLWNNIGLPIAIPASGGTVSTLDTSNFIGANAVAYRALVLDNIQTTTSNSSNMALIAPVYYGVGPSNPTVSLITSLTKVLSGSRVNGQLVFNPNNQRFFYAYPQSWGQLISIYDQNGFNILGGFELSTFVLTYPDGQTETYNLYTGNANTTVTNFKLSFN